MEVNRHLAVPRNEERARDLLYLHHTTRAKSFSLTDAAQADIDFLVMARGELKVGLGAIRREREKAAENALENARRILETQRDAAIAGLEELERFRSTAFLLARAESGDGRLPETLREAEAVCGEGVELSYATDGDVEQQIREVPAPKRRGPLDRQREVGLDELLGDPNL